MKSDWPKISIVTPVFNARPFIEAAIKSVQNQNYPNLEYIIIDGGSTDGTVGIIKKYAKYLTYWVSEADKGQTEALNKGFKRATGVLYGWLNADEEYLPGVLKCVAKIYMASKDLELIYGNRYWEDSTVCPTQKTLQTIPHNIKPFSYIFYTGRTLFTDATFWTKKIHDQLIGLDERFLHYSMDTEWFLRMTGVAKKWKHIEQPFSIFKLHGLNACIEGGKKGIRLNEIIRREYASNNNISIIKLFLGWLYYSTRLRIWEKGFFGLLKLPKWDTFAYLFLNKNRK